MTTVIVPAHNEGVVIGRLLGGLLAGTRPGELEIIVVANGCTDDTAEVVASFWPRVRLINVPVASKYAALAAGDRAASGFPRIYVDADIEIRVPDIRALAAALAEPGTLAAAPRRIIRLAGTPWQVRWYYDVWSRLPKVRDELFARGAIGVNQAGHARIASLPTLLADDLAIALAFAPAERRIVAGARAVIHPPRTVADLLRRRIRAAHGVTQLERADGAPPSTARTSPADLLRIAAARPWLAPQVAFFLLVAVAAKLMARRYLARGDFTTWLRDESSRQPAPAADAPAARAGAPAAEAEAVARAGAPAVGAGGPTVGTGGPAVRAGGPVGGTASDTAARR